MTTAPDPQGISRCHLEVLFGAVSLNSPAGVDSYRLELRAGPAVARKGLAEPDPTLCGIASQPKFFSAKSQLTRFQNAATYLGRALR